MMEEQQSIIGAIKIKDGLFIGDEYAAQDLEFVVTNKVTHIINCAGQNIGNIWEQIGVMYLTFPWTQSDQQILFDEQDEILNEIVKFIDEAAEAGESTLVHSIKGQSRACCVLAAYFMKKYNWALLKTLEFLNSRRPELEIRSTFFQQLTNLSKKLQITGTGAMIQDWHEVSYGPNGFVHVDELIVRNTFLNSRNAPVADIFSDQQVQMQMMRKEKKDKLTWNDIHHNRDLQFAVIPNPDTFNPIQHYRSSSLNKKVLKSCLKGSNKHVRVGSEGQMLQLNQQQQIQKGGMARSLSGKQIGVFDSQLKYNKSAKNLVEDTVQVGNQPSFLLNTSLQKAELHSNPINNNYQNMMNQDNSNQIQSNQIAEVNTLQQHQNILQNHPKSQSLYQQLQQIPVQSYNMSLSQQSSFHQQQPQLSQQIRSIQQQLPISSQLLQPNQVGLSSHTFTQNNQSGLQSQQYQQLNNYQQFKNQTPQLQTLGVGTNNYLNNINPLLNNNSTTNNNNISLSSYSNDYKNSNINTLNPISCNSQQLKNQGDILLKTLNSTNTSSKNANTFQNALTLNSVNASGSKSINQSAITSPYNQKNITNTLSMTLNDKRNNATVSSSNSGSKNNKMMPPQSASMQEKKQNLISKILEQQPQQTSSTINTSSSLIRSNSLRGFENEKEPGSSKHNNIQSKNSTSGISKTNPTNQSVNTSSNTSILQKNNTSFGSQLGNDQSSTVATANINLSQPLSSQLQSGYRSNSLPKSLEDQRSPSSKLQYQLQQNNRHSSVSTKEKQESLLQQQKNQFSYLNNEMKNSQIQQNGTDKPRLQQNYIRSSSANNEQASSNESANSKPQQSHCLASQNTQQKQTLSSLMGVKSPVNNSNLKAGYLKNERPPLKPREQNSLTSTTNNTNSSVNTSLSKSFQQSTLSKYSANSNLQSQQTSTSDSNRYNNNNFTQFSNSNFSSSLNNNFDLKVTPSTSSITQNIQNKMQMNSIPTSISSDSSRANDNKYNNIPSSSQNKSPINGGPSMKTPLMSKPPQSKPQQSFDKCFKENQNVQPYTIYQPMQNNFMESQKVKDNITVSSSSLGKQNTSKVTPSYRSYSPAIQSLQNKLDKQKQMGTSKNRIRSNSPGQALSYHANNTSNTQFNQLSNQVGQNIFGEQKIDYLKQSSNINAISSESENIFTLSNGLLNSNISSSKPRWKF